MKFFINPSRIPEDGRELVGALFKDWFLLERKLTRCGLTPLDLSSRPTSGVSTIARRPSIARWRKTAASAYLNSPREKRANGWT